MIGHWTRQSRRIACCLPVALLAFASTAAAATPMAKIVKVGTFSAPVQVVQPPGQTTRLWVVRKRGQISVMSSGKVLPAAALDIGGQVSFGAEQGLLGLAFAPDYATSHRAYVTYTDKANQLVLAEYQGTFTSLNPATKRVVMAIPKPHDDHNGGTIKFGADGYLYIGTGDGGGPGDMHGTIGNAQDLGSLLGKILRIDPRASGAAAYSVPTSNPFYGISGLKPEVWAYGLRNPWKWSFAPDGAMWIGDVGQDTFEEIDRISDPGANLGWRIMEGPRIREGDVTIQTLTPPLVAYRHGAATGCAVIGGVVVRDAKLTKLSGKYVYGDFCHPILQWISYSSGAVKGKGSTSIRFPSMVVSIDEDLTGRVYVTLLTGAVYRLSA